MTDAEFEALETDNSCYSISTDDADSDIFTTCDPRLGSDNTEFKNTFKRTCHSTFNKNHRIEYRYDSLIISENQLENNLSTRNSTTVELMRGCASDETISGLDSSSVNVPNVTVSGTEPSFYLSKTFNCKPKSIGCNDDVTEPNQLSDSKALASTLFVLITSFMNL